MRKAAALRLAVVAFGVFGLSACGGDSTTNATPADSDISVMTTDIESMHVGTEQQCIERLTQVVDVDYLREHDLRVTDEASVTLEIENAVREVCADIDPNEVVHPAAHEVVHMVEDALR